MLRAHICTYRHVGHRNVGRASLANHVAPGDANETGGRSLTRGLSVQTPLAKPAAGV
jgi:hypothetical protein